MNEMKDDFKSKYIDIIIKLNDRYSPVESYVLNGIWYGLIWQCQIQTIDNIRNEYCVRRIELEGIDCENDDGTLIKYPTHIYDSKSDSRLAIILNANQDLWTGNVSGEVAGDPDVFEP